MGCMFQISISRVLTPAEGQVALTQMMRHIEQPGSTVGVGTLPPSVGVHVTQNPFPQWLTEKLVTLIPGLLFDDVNFFFYRVYESLAEAQHFESWIRGPLTEWSRHDPVKLEVMSRVHTRIMRDYVGQVPAGDVDVF